MTDDSHRNDDRDWERVKYPEVCILDGLVSRRSSAKQRVIRTTRAACRPPWVNVLTEEAKSNETPT